MIFTRTEFYTQHSINSVWRIKLIFIKYSDENSENTIYKSCLTFLNHGSTVQVKHENSTLFYNFDLVVTIAIS